MKKLLLVFIFLVGIINIGFSQETIVYTFFVNIVPEEFHFPLIGFINIAKGSHTVPQIGFVNWNTGNFSSLQASFINTVGGNMNGAQVGFINTTANDTKGSQVGFVNTSVGNMNGTQVGFINTVADDTKGLQFGFVNTAAKSGEGLQFGFVNTSAQKIKGVQIGFINYTDTIEGGIPIGFISIVRHGGYQAVQYSFSEFYPLIIEFKLGVEIFYTNIIAAYNPFKESDPKQIFMGLGIGSIFPISKYFFLNPELNSLVYLFSDENNQLLSFIPFFGFSLNKNFSITAGPSITWVHAFRNTELQKPIFKIIENSIDENNSIVIGARLGVRFRF